MKRFAITALLLTVVVCPAYAQQKVTFKTPDPKYEASHNVDVGDIPGHIVRVFAWRAIPDTPPVVNGLKIVEILNRGTVEMTNSTGGAQGTMLFVADNGDKIVTRWTAANQLVGGKPMGTTAGYITGGTGKFTGIQGTMRMNVNFDPSQGGALSNLVGDIEYTISK
jgi:hypothetical protein